MYMQKESLAVLALAAFACAQYGAPSGNPGYGGVGASPSNDYGQKVPGPAGGDGNSEPEPFNFAYEVKDAPTYTDFKHQANSDGKRVTGEYSVLLPDGRNQRVTYVADENGYNAQVNYEGEAKPQPSGPAQGRYPAPASGSQGAYPAASGPQPGYASPAAPQSGYGAQGSYPAASGVKGYSASIPSQSSYPAPSPSSYSAPSPSSYPAPSPSSYPSPAQGGYSAPSGYPSSVKASYAAPQGNNGGY